MSNFFVGRLFLIIGFLLLAALFSWETFGQEIAVVDVKNTIPMSEDDPNYRDYILHGPIEQLKENLVVNVVRKTAYRDYKNGQNFGELNILVGQIKIISTQDGLAVGREFKDVSRASAPVLDQMGIQLGDFVSMKGSFIDNTKPSARKTAAVSKPVIVPAATPAESPSPAVTTTPEVIAPVAVTTEK